MADQEGQPKKSPEKSTQVSKEPKHSGQSHGSISNKSTFKPKGQSKQGPSQKNPGQIEYQSPTGSGNNNNNNKLNNKKYTVKKRPPPKDVPQRVNDVYITDRSNFNAQLSKCQKLFDGEYSEVFLHGLGSAIPRAINVALELQKFYQGTVDYTVNTSTVKLIDDLIPLDDATPPSQQTRKVSCVDIKVFRTIQIP